MQVEHAHMLCRKVFYASQAYKTVSRENADQSPPRERVSVENVGYIISVHALHYAGSAPDPVSKSS